MPEEYYVYAYLREDGTPYYIGKGKDDRAYRRSDRVILPPNDKIKIKIILQNLTEEQAFSNERDYIAWYGRKDKGTGILRNLTDGGEGSSGRIPSDETRRKISESNIGKISSRRGVILSDETRRKISESAKDNKKWLGRKHSEETKKLIGEKSKGRKPMLGKKHSAETIKKISQAASGKKLSEETRKKMSGKIPWNKGKSGYTIENGGVKWGEVVNQGFPE